MYWISFIFISFAAEEKKYYRYYGIPRYRYYMYRY